MSDLLFETGDVTRRKHGGNAASVAANDRVRKNTDNAVILAIFKRVFKTTSKDVALEMNKPLNAVSGRFSYLKKAGLIRDTNTIAPNGCSWLEITEKGLKA